MRTLILTEGGQEIGFGHLTRCRALADAFKKEGFSVTLVAQGDNSIKRFFLQGIDHVLNWRKNSARFEELLKSAEIVVIDSYLAPPRFYHRIAARPVLPVFIDDYMRFEYPEGILINGGIGAEKFPYPPSKRFPRLLGTRYALVRKEFWHVKKRTARRSIRDVLVTFGGIKRERFVAGFLSGISRRFPDVRFHAVLSSRQFKWPVLSTANLKLYFGLPAARMRDLMLQCDIAISGGGQTTNELSRCGIPIIGIRFAANQILNLKGWKDSGVLIPGAYWKDKNLLPRITALLSGISYRQRAAMSRQGRQRVDGQGAKRIARILKIFQLHLIPAARTDSRRIFLWANDLQTRAMSFQTAPIRWKNHQKWFEAQLRRPGLSFFVACFRKKKIGSVRFQKNGPRATISLMLAPKFRGHGLGARLILVASHRMFSRFPLQRIDAFIKPQNKASKKIFRKAGFEFFRRTRIKEQTAEHWIMRKP